MRPETIAAPITAPGHAAVAAVRVSGARTTELVRLVARRSDEILAAPRSVVFSELVDGESVIDHALVTYFQGPNSFTGEDSAEFYLHGSPYLVQCLMQTLLRLGAQTAKPGEFTERAFLNGKLDLSQAEAVADLVHAESEAQARVAREQLEGRLSHTVTELGTPLRELLAEIEAHIDFPDEDIEPLAYGSWGEVVAKLGAAVQRYTDSFSTGKLYREGASVVLVGLPNVGKSSLMNRLMGEDRAIVTPIAGTTRDSIEERISLEGLLVRLCDTAGLEGGGADVHRPDPVEQLGIERSWKRARAADLVIYLFDVTQEFDAEQALLAQVRVAAQNLLVVGNKIDLNSQAVLPEGSIAISAETGAGLAALRAEIVRRLLGEQRGGGLVITNQRHLEALTRAQAALSAAVDGLARRDPPEFISVLIRSALAGLEEIVGVTTTEDLLGLIFSKFCIGK